MINTYVALDLETTGLSPEENEILEIGALLVEDGVVTDSYKTFVQCQGTISPRITELTGITQEMSMSGITEQQAIEEIATFCEGRVLLGHNVKFDYSFLKAKADKYKRAVPDMAIDTLRIARKKLNHLESRSLEYLCHYYQIPPKVSHRAYDDAESAMKLYRIFQQEFAEEEDLFKLVQMKYKVKKEAPITAAQIGYLNDLLAHHKLTPDYEVEKLTKSEASKKIDAIILQYGKITRAWR